VIIYDPVISATELATHIPDLSVAASLREAVKGASVVIIANNHPALGEQAPLALGELMVTGGFIYDYWNHFSKLSDGELGSSYFAVGNTRSGKA
jgi:UDP-N-acetyl-D-mannosaminuronic acid dehydrogenase